MTMHATERKFHLRRAALRALADCNGYPLVESALRARSGAPASLEEFSPEPVDAGNE